jgi:arylsulfatase
VTRSTRWYLSLALCAASACAAAPEAPQAPAAAPGASAGLDRTVLPIADPSYPASTQLEASKATPPARFEVKAPADAPNVVVVLLDDFGFGQSSTFGGAIEMPNLDRLAADATTTSTSQPSARRRASPCRPGVIIIRPMPAR